MDFKFGVNVDDEIFGYVNTKENSIKYVENLADKIEEMWKKLKPHKKFYQEGIKYENDSEKIFEISLYGYTPGNLWNGSARSFNSVKCYPVIHLEESTNVEIEEPVLVETKEQEEEIIKKDFEEQKVIDYEAMNMGELSFNSIDFGGRFIPPQRTYRSVENFKKEIKEIVVSKSVSDLLDTCDVIDDVQNEIVKDRTMGNTNENPLEKNPFLEEVSDQVEEQNKEFDRQVRKTIRSTLRVSENSSSSDSSSSSSDSDSSSSSSSSDRTITITRT